MSKSSDTPQLDSTPTPSSEIQRLGALVGRWRSEGHIVGEVPVPITGTDIYEWLPGGFFLVHHVDVMIGDQRVQAIELIARPGAQRAAAGQPEADPDHDEGSELVARRCEGEEKKDQQKQDHLLPAADRPRRQFAWEFSR